MKVDKKLLKASRFVHVYLSIILLILLVFFSITGITLNHPSWGGGLTESSKTVQLSLQFPGIFPLSNSESLLESPDFRRFIKQEFKVDLDYSELEDDGNLLIIDAQKPGQAILLELDLVSGDVFVSDSDYGWIAFFNDLHKGRHTQVLWRGLIDFSAVVLVIFSLAGLMLLLPHKKKLGRAISVTLVGISLLVGGWWISS